MKNAYHPVLFRPFHFGPCKKARDSHPAPVVGNPLLITPGSLKMHLNNKADTFSLQFNQFYMNSVGFIRRFQFNNYTSMIDYTDMARTNQAGITNVF
jgi:hypothetical protein